MRELNGWQRLSILLTLAWSVCAAWLVWQAWPAPVLTLARPTSRFNPCALTISFQYCERQLVAAVVIWLVPVLLAFLLWRGVVWVRDGFRSAEPDAATFVPRVDRDGVGSVGAKVVAAERDPLVP
jgi:hypothetical protein